jgi:hypothetical protein
MRSGGLSYLVLLFRDGFEPATRYTPLPIPHRLFSSEDRDQSKTHRDEMSCPIGPNREEACLTMTQTDRNRELYRITVTIHDVEHAARAGSDLAAALSEAGLAARAGDVRSESARRALVVVFDALEAGEVPAASDVQDTGEEKVLRGVSLLRERPAALLPAVRTLLALSRAREASELSPHQRMTIEIEPWASAIEAAVEREMPVRDDDPDRAVRQGGRTAAVAS